MRCCGPGVCLPRRLCQRGWEPAVGTARSTAYRHLRTGVSPSPHPWGHSSLCQGWSLRGGPTNKAPWGEGMWGNAGDPEPPGRRVGGSSPPCRVLLEGGGCRAVRRCALCLRRERLCREGAAQGRPGWRKSSDKIKGLLSHAEEPGGRRASAEATQVSSARPRRLTPAHSESTS